MSQFKYKKYRIKFLYSNISFYIIESQIPSHRAFRFILSSYKSLRIGHFVSYYRISYSFSNTITKYRIKFLYSDISSHIIELQIFLYRAFRLILSSYKFFRIRHFVLYHRIFYSFLNTIIKYRIKSLYSGISSHIIELQVSSHKIFRLISSSHKSLRIKHFVLYHRTFYSFSNTIIKYRIKFFYIRHFVLYYRTSHFFKFFYIKHFVLYHRISYSFKFFHTSIKSRIQRVSYNKKKK